MTTLLIPGQKVHIVGICGFGMSAIARILLETGYIVTGSDKNMSPLGEALVRDGAKISLGHDAGNVIGAEVILASSAITEDNIEIKSARSLGIPILWRKDAIAMITGGHRTIAIAGTHGKTTTTALMAHTLIEAGLDPNYIVGGVMHNTFTNAGVGKGDNFVIEADEYGKMFLGLTPTIGVITNIEYDHPDVFQNMQELLDVFAEFADLVDETGLLVVCADSPPALKIAEKRLAHGLHVSTYGIQNPKAEWHATNIEFHPKSGMVFNVMHRKNSLGEIHLNQMGDHNIQNGLAVIAIARYLGVPFADIVKAFANFAGTGRRSEVIGKMAGVTIVSDYAHHPTAIRAMVDTWAKHPDTKRLWAVWQPHTYSRLRALAPEFAASFAKASQVLVTDVYSVRETPIEGLSAPNMAEMIRETGQDQARYSGDLDLTTELLIEDLREGDTVLIMSAGDAPQIAQKILQRLAVRPTKTEDK